MRIVFFGTPELAVPSLAALAVRHEVAALVCQPDRPQGRGRQLVPPPTKTWAAAGGIPVVQPVKLNDGGFQNWLKEQLPDICVVVAYGRILKQPILDVPKHGFINVHPSLLPRHRGPAPIQAAILEGDNVTGVTIMRLDAGVDTGDILMQRKLAILPEDTAETLSERLAALGANMLVEALERVASGKAVFTPQDHSKATITHPFTKQDGRVRWSQSARAIHNLVRAATPWPGTQARFRGQTYRIHKTQIVDEPADVPAGTVARVEPHRVLVATGQGLLAILVFQAPGGKPMPMADYLRGHTIHPGDVFEGF